MDYTTLALVIVAAFVLPILGIAALVLGGSAGVMFAWFESKYPRTGSVLRITALRMRLCYNRAKELARKVHAYVVRAAEQRRARKEQALKELEARRPPQIIDTEGAIEDMRLAHSYLEDWIEKKDSGKRVLSFAAKYIELARSKDPNAILVVEENGEPCEFSQDDLAGRTLFYEAQEHRVRHAKPKELRLARDALLRAISYKPHSIQYRDMLADVYLDLHERHTALAVAQEAVNASPKNLDARKLLDRIEAAPCTRPPTFFEANPELLAIIGSLMFAAGFVFVFMSIFFDTGGLAGILIVVGGLIWFVGSRKEKSQMLQKALADEMRKRPDRRRQTLQRTRAVLHTCL